MLEPTGAHSDVLAQAVACDQHLLAADNGPDLRGHISKVGKAVAWSNELIVHRTLQL